jgi:hypothetical protein
LPRDAGLQQKGIDRLQRAGEDFTVFQEAKSIEWRMNRMADEMNDARLNARR